jgi:hypothetical protein
LYGDWGTSKAYVIGLAFAVAGYSSFWLIAAMCVLTALVGLNYMVICRLYPDGGGVYASVRHRSEGRRRVSSPDCAVGARPHSRREQHPQSAAPLLSGGESPLRARSLASSFSVKSH